jgi:IS30 family transposase
MLLRNAGKAVFTAHGVRIVADPEVSFVSKRGRKKVYPEELTPHLKTLWELSGCISSKHLAVFIRTNQDFIFDHPKLKGLREETREMLLRISPASIDRRLGPIRKKEELAKRYKPNPHASNIKKRIPVQTHFDKPRASFGLAEIDLVFHCGESTQGDFAYTLTVTEITTGWTELRVIQNRAQVWSVSALKEIVNSLPFKVTALHSDNGSEFINAYLPHKPTSWSCGDPECG